MYLPFPALRIVALVALCLATIAATLTAIRLWRPARREPFLLFAAGEAVGFAAGALGSSAAVTRAGGSVAAAALTMVAYVIGIGGYAVLIRARRSGRDRASLIDATVISTGVGMLAWVFLAAPYSVDASLPLVERVLSMVYVMLDVLVLATDDDDADGQIAAPIVGPHDQADVGATGGHFASSVSVERLAASCRR